LRRVGGVVDVDFDGSAFVARGDLEYFVMVRLDVAWTGDITDKGGKHFVAGVYDSTHDEDFVFRREWPCTSVLREAEEECEGAALQCSMMPVGHSCSVFSELV